MKRYLIIGGVAGGMSAAARLRRMTEEDEIIVFEKGEYVSFANCGLPYYIGNTIKNRNHLLLQTPAAFHERFNVDVRINSEVTAIDRAARRVKVRNLETGKEYEAAYDKLVLSPGADPVKPPIPGINHERIFTLRNIPDTDRIHDFIDREKPASAAVIGGGYIGLEMAENLQHRGVQTTVVEALPQVMNMIDFEMAAIIHDHIRKHNVQLILNDKVLEFKDTPGKGISIQLDSGREISADMVILSIGVKPNTELARACGLATGQRGGILVNEFLQTSDEHIYALGDAIEVPNPLVEIKAAVPLAGPANKQGRIAADNIVTGNTEKYTGTIGSAVLKVFDLTVAMTGAGNKLLKQEKKEFLSTVIHPAHHAGYYPGAAGISLKLLFAPGSGKILGAQAVGTEGVEKRIDVIAAFIQKEGTVYDLTAFEHCYAPPYSSAKDPVNMAGFVGQNILEGKVHTINWDELEAEKDGLLLDVRTPGEFKHGTIPGAVNIPLNDLRSRLDEIDPSGKILVFCKVGMRGYLAARILMQHGYKEVYNLSGGYTTYQHVMQQ